MNEHTKDMLNLMKALCKVFGLELRIRGNEIYIAGERYEYGVNMLGMIPVSDLVYSVTRYNKRFGGM